MWPDEHRCAAALTFDLDAESVWLQDRANAKNPAYLSQGRYGPKVAVPLILELLDKEELAATFFVPGTVAENYPNTVMGIVERGHELAAHGYEHASPASLPPEEEEKSLVKTLSILGEFQSPVLGYRPPMGDFSEHTLSLLEKHGFLYSSNMMDDIRPYRHPGMKVIELPIHWMIDDSAHFWFGADSWNKKISTPSEVREVWDGEFGGIYQLGGIFTLLMHPQIIGRPSRLEMLKEFIAFMKSHEGVWISTCANIAQYLASVLP
jgi:peptidoglycan/xylan/chitin deacetylase (PgdA/CDA1 family)